MALIAARWRALGAGFDDAALRPFDATSAPAWPALRDWCLSDLKQPWQTALHRAPDVGMARQRAAALALALDGSDRLAACQNAAARIQLRLSVKLQDARLWRSSQVGDVWDSGCVPDEQSAWQALARFQPRRPTFIVVQGGLSHERLMALAALEKRSAGFAKPVRVLALISPGDAAPPGAIHIPA